MEADAVDLLQGFAVTGNSFRAGYPKVCVGQDFSSLIVYSDIVYKTDMLWTQGNFVSPNSTTSD